MKTLEKIFKKLYDNSIYLSWDNIFMQNYEKSDTLGFSWKNINTFNNIKEELEEEGSTNIILYIKSIKDTSFIIQIFKKHNFDVVITNNKLSFVISKEDLPDIIFESNNISKDIKNIISSRQKKSLNIELFCIKCNNRRDSLNVNCPDICKKNNLNIICECYHHNGFIIENNFQQDLKNINTENAIEGKYNEGDEDESDVGDNIMSDVDEIEDNNIVKSDVDENDSDVDENIENDDEVDSNEDNNIIKSDVGENIENDDEVDNIIKCDEDENIESDVDSEVVESDESENENDNKESEIDSSDDDSSDEEDLTCPENCKCINCIEENK